MQFVVEIPEGGLSLPDNCVAFLDQISVPSFQNVFAGKHRLFVQERAPAENQGPTDVPRNSG